AESRHHSANERNGIKFLSKLWSPAGIAFDPAPPFQFVLSLPTVHGVAHREFVQIGACWRKHPFRNLRAAIDFVPQVQKFRLMHCCGYPLARSRNKDIQSLAVVNGITDSRRMRF